MQIEELNEIMKTANLRAIKRALKAAGFRNCRWNRRLRKASLYDIAKAPYEKTPYFPDGKGNEYVADLCRGVKDYGQYVFVIVQLLAPYRRGCEDLSTKKMPIYAKKL